MQSHFRAGLVGLILALFLVLTSAAPILPNQVSSASSLSQGAPGPHSLAQQLPLDVAPGRSRLPPIAVANTDGMAVRDMVTLYRRKSIFTKIKDGIKHVAEKIGHFVQTTGAKIAKVALKVWSTAQKAVSKVAQFIPVIGKPLSKALDVASTITNKASDAIHAKIGGKLGLAMNRMNKGQKVMGYIPRELVERYEERGFGELDERELYAVNMLLDARATNAPHERGRYEWEVSGIY